MLGVENSLMITPDMWQLSKLVRCYKNQFPNMVKTEYVMTNSFLKGREEEERGYIRRG